LELRIKNGGLISKRWADSGCSIGEGVDQRRCLVSLKWRVLRVPAGAIGPRAIPAIKVSRRSTERPWRCVQRLKTAALWAERPSRGVQFDPAPSVSATDSALAPGRTALKRLAGVATHSSNSTPHTRHPHVLLDAGYPTSTTSCIQPCSASSPKSYWYQIKIHEPQAAPVSSHPFTIHPRFRTSNCANQPSQIYSLSQRY